MVICIAFIGTGRYLNYLPNWYEHIMKNFLPDTQKQILVFTDGELEDIPENVSIYKIPHKPWPYITLERFETLALAKSEILSYDNFVFLDADTLVLNKISEVEIFDTREVLFGVHHPCHFMKMEPHTQWPGAFETNSQSTAYVSEFDNPLVYFQGCFWGGFHTSVMNMIEQLAENVKLDLSKNIIATWHDESHLNNYFTLNRNSVRILGPEYAYPEVFSQYCTFAPKIVHLAKDNSRYHSI